jgi:hypothetical protein
MRKLLLLLAILPFMISRNGQEKNGTKSLLEESLQLNNFNFQTNISTLLPKESKSKDFNGYDVKSESLEVDTISIANNGREYIGNENPVKFIYHQFTYSNDEILAKFDDCEFNAINFVTSKNGKIIAINVLIDQIEFNKAKSILQTLAKKYGNANKTQGFTSKHFDIYTWKLKDRMIRYSIAKADKFNEKDSDLFTGYLYIIDNNNINFSCNFKIL